MCNNSDLQSDTIRSIKEEQAVISILHTGRARKETSGL